MSTHTATIRWKNQGPDFRKRKYPREHTWHFDGGTTVMGSSSPQVVALPWSNPEGVDPEEAFIASVASCHMLWFLDVAISAGYCAESYQDSAEGFMTRNDRGVYWISKIVLHPQIVWGGNPVPTIEQIAELHHRAHEQCFIANSVKTEIVVAPESRKDEQI